MATSAQVLSIVIPAFNEERFIGELLRRVAAVDLSAYGFFKQVLVVDDCSTDRTADIVRATPNVVYVRQPQNAGKGAAVRAGLGHARGDVIVIQDADLEYDPEDYRPMLETLLSTSADAVYGSRYWRKERGWFANLAAGRHPNQSWTAYLGGKSLSVVAAVLTGRYLTDTVTALKMFRRDALAGLALETTGFELDHEITSKLIARGRRIVEVPIRYAPRSREEGKKIGARDWLRAVRTFWRYRRVRRAGL